MKVPEHPELIQNETIYLNETFFPILSLEVMPGKFTDPNRTKFNWTYVDFTPKELVLQLDFEHSSYISSISGYPDSIRLTIFGFQYFADNLGQYMYPPTYLSQKTLPPMASKS